MCAVNRGKQVEHENGAGTAVVYLVVWALTVFISASSWHIWRYLNDGDSHAIIKAKAIHISFSAFIGAMLGLWLTIFLLLVTSFLDSIIGITEFGLLEELGSVGIMVVFFACTQASTGIYMLKDGNAWKNYLSDSEREFVDNIDDD